MNQHQTAGQKTVRDAIREHEVEDAKAVRSRAALELRVRELAARLRTAEHDQRQQLREKERLTNRLELLLQALPGGVVVLDRDGVVQECNRAAQDIFNESLRGTLWRDVVARSISPRQGDRDITLTNGRRVDIATCSLGEEPGQILLIRDITQTRRLELRLARLERLSEMGKMMATLAHQIRSPLASALLSGSNLRGTIPSQPAPIRMWTRLMNRLRHLEQLINDMLDFARHGSLTVSRIRVDEWLLSFSATLQPQLEAHGVALRLDCVAPGAYVDGSAEALGSSLQNIVDNAVQAAGRGARLSLSAQVDTSGQLRVSLTDNGPGIPVHEQKRVFEPFFTTRAEGTGLGLAIVRSIVEAHEGRVTLSSEPDVGTTVCMFVPLATDTATASPSRAREASSKDTLT